MKKVYVGLLAAAIAVGISGSVMAQGGRPGGGFGMGRGGGGIFILRMKEVQTELKMTEPQVSKLDSKQQEVSEKMREMFQAGSGPGGDPAEREKMMAKIQEISGKAVMDILDTTQMKRFKQLELQQMGAGALSRKEVSEELKITADQKKQIADLQQKLQASMREARQGVDFRNLAEEERTKMMTKVQEMNKASSEKVMSVLTESQRKQLKELQGAPFKFPAPGPPRGGRPPLG